MPAAIADYESSSERNPGGLPALSLTVFGWLISGYLLRLLMNMNAGRAPEPLYCAACEEAVAGQSANAGGLPLAGWGLVYFAVLGLMLSVGVRPALKLAAMVSAAGAGASARLSFALLSGLSLACPACMAVHAINFVLLWLLWRQTRSEDGLRIALPLMVIVAGLLSFALVRDPFNTSSVLSSYESSRRIEIPSHPLDPVLGPGDGPVRLVVFSSFQCPACKWFNGITHRLQRRFGDRLSITFKHFPLSRNCNPGVSIDMQPRACAAAAAAEAANRQGMFWRYHDDLYASSLEASEPLLEAIARNAGVNFERWRTDRESQLVQAKVRTDAEMGSRLGVNGTPAVFLNGRRVEDISLPSLAMLIRHELAPPR